MDLTGALLQPDSIVALRAIDSDARAATFRVWFGTGFNSTTCTLDQLPPTQRFGALGSIFIDNTNNLAPITITFPDTGAADTIPPGCTSWMLAITGGTRFQLTSACAAATQINVQALNVVVPPTGVQAISGVSLSVAANVAVSNAVQIAAGAADIGTVHVAGPVTLAAGAALIGDVQLVAGAADVGIVHLAAGAAAIGSVTIGAGAADVGTVHLATGTQVIAEADSVTIATTVPNVTAADSVVLAANAAAKYRAFCNVGTSLCTLNFGAAAVSGAGWPLAPAAVAGGQGGILIFEDSAISRQAVHGICPAGQSTTLAVLEA